ncbi:flagellar hook-associated protein 2 [Ornithinibacillus sp. L9]|uniref:Flagellar hook-associated protein 2 n=2 Tax=Ornithinibacillus caprae TaxID=2678566 RepID=A0A6N8FS51_9BACI|nr:flagellar hook-associated protein 2 [Ornithinibacillus caprae]MUK90798.1 flagellar hook-associated protein 2 [Ornithinibacillus caprae]
MRVGGLSSGMDIESIVNNLMSAERMPLQKMEQDRTLLEWKRDGFREVYQKLYEFDEMILDMKLSSTYNSKSVSSSQESAVTATGSTSAGNGTYSINVTELAKSAINVSSGEVEIDPNTPLKDTNYAGGFGEFTNAFETFNKDGSTTQHTIEIKETDTLNDVLKRISSADNNVRAFYDQNTQKVILETTRTGNYNADPNVHDGAEVVFNHGFFTDTLKLDTANETGGENAQFQYNGIEMTSYDNSYKLGGVTFQFKDKTNGTAILTVENDVDASFEKIMKFVDTYNEIVDMINGSQHEEKYRDYKPLTQEQKDEMSDKEIELWEERAKSGILRGESSLSSGLFSMRQSWYSTVDTGGSYTSVTQVGIKTSSNYMDGGKLIVDEEELKNALREDPASIQNLFSKNAEGNSRGLVNRVEDALETTMKQIEQRAGKPTSITLDNYTLGKRMKDLNSRISAFEARMVQVENRYWSQFTAMEKAISQMNQQSSQLMSQFGGM